MSERLDFIRKYLEAYRAEIASNGFLSPELDEVIRACDPAVPFEP